MGREHARISSPVHQMRSHYDVVVIGSGYGGGIAASRMSRSGKTVAVLEKGQERWPGEFPEDTLPVLDEFTVSSANSDYGKSTGLYKLYLGKSQHAFVAQGLGGTSLLNANVALEADRRIWEQNIWPRALSQDSTFPICRPKLAKPWEDELDEDLDDPKNMPEAYLRAHQMLEPTTYPDEPEFPPLTKLEMLKKQATKRGLGSYFRKAPITVSFEDRLNAAGVPMRKSRLTGNDATGINDGSKGTTLVTYVSDAWNHGAEIFCECSVRNIKRQVNADGSEKWVVFYEWLGGSRTRFSTASKSAVFWVTADMVFLGAGAIGSTEILLRSRRLGLNVSSNVGKSYSGNGDILAFGANNNEACHSVGTGSNPPESFRGREVGPCIAGVIDLRRRPNEDVMKGMVIEEGVTPLPLANLLPTAFAMSAGSKACPDTQVGYLERLKRKARSLETTMRGPYYGAMDNTMTYLVMSHDNNQGHLELINDRLNIDFGGVGKSHRCREINQTILANLAHSTGGDFEPSPFWTRVGADSLITVHSIGGCCMAENGQQGVVNDKGQVFIDHTTSGNVHDSLYVCDGAIIPMALGVNPFFTISALAERICFYAVQDHPEFTPWDPNECKESIDIPQKVRKVLYAEMSEVVNGVKKPIPIDFKHMTRRSPSRDQVKEQLEWSSHNPAARRHLAVQSENTTLGGVTFTEVMTGYFATVPAWEHNAGAKVKIRRASKESILNAPENDSDPEDDDNVDYQAAADHAKTSDSRMQFLLTIMANTTDSLSNFGDRSALITGTVSCRALSPDPLLVEFGNFRLFSEQPSRADTDNLLYHLHLLSTGGRRFEFFGKKVVHNGNLWNGWKETTTLYVTVKEYKGTEEALRKSMVMDARGRRPTYREDVTLVGHGILKIGIADLARELMTLSSNSASRIGRLKDEGIFLTYFARRMAKHFLTPLWPLEYRYSDPVTAIDYDHSNIRSRPVRIEFNIADASAQCKILRWKGSNDETQLKGPILLVPGAAVTHAIYSSEINTGNLLDYLLAKNYDVWIVDHRLSPNVPASAEQHTVDAVRHDIAAAVRLVRKETKVKSIAMIAHCLGSVATFMGLLDGTITGVGLLVASNVGMHPVVGSIDRWKMYLRLQDIYTNILRQDMFETWTEAKDTLLNRIMNQVLRFYPLPAGEGCSSAICHRSSFAFGLLWKHRNLSERVHANLHAFIRNVNMTAMKQLTTMASNGKLCDASGDVKAYVTKDNIHRNLRHIPIRFIHGSDNVVYDPFATIQDFDILRDRNPKKDSSFYTRRLIKGYAHLDCFMGSHAPRDVYDPHINDHLELYSYRYGYEYMKQAAKGSEYDRKLSLSFDFKKDQSALYMRRSNGGNMSSSTEESDLGDHLASDVDDQPTPPSSLCAEPDAEPTLYKSPATVGFHLGK